MIKELLTVKQTENGNNASTPKNFESEIVSYSFHSFLPCAVFSRSLNTIFHADYR